MELSEIKCSVCPYHTNLAAVKEEICDKYCRYPWEMTQEELDQKCADCPLEKLG